MTELIWVEKYRPKYLEQIKNQEEAIAKVLSFVKDFGKKKRAIVLHGPPGTGKTTIAHAIAKEKNSEIFELNASDLRNKGKLQEVLRPAMEQQSLLKKNKIIGKVADAIMLGQNQPISLTGTFIKAQ